MSSALPSIYLLVVQLVIMFLSLMQGIFSLPLTLVFWSIHVISYFSIVSSWDIHEVAVSFIRYDSFLRPFVLCSVMLRYLAYSMELSGSVCCQLEYWKHNCEVPFICVLSIVHTHYRRHFLMHLYKLTLDFFYQSQNLRRLVLKCYLFSQSRQEHVEWGWFVHTNSWLCFCHSTSVLRCLFCMHDFGSCMI